MNIPELKAILIQEIPRIYQTHITNVSSQDKKFQAFFDQHLHWMKPVITGSLGGMIEAAFTSHEEYLIFLDQLKEQNRIVGSTFLLQVPELSPNDVLELNQNLYFHLISTCVRVTETEKVSTELKSQIIERLYITFSTSDHSFLQGYLQLKDKQVFDLHQQKLSLVGQMAAGMAHEIRNPLTSIKGFIQLIMEQLRSEKLDKDDLHFYLSICEEQMNSLDSVVSNFLSLVRNKSGRSSAEWYILTSVLERIQVLAQFYALEKSVSFTIHIPEYEVKLFGSPSDLEQISLNIIRNAMDAVSAGGHGKVHLEVLDQADEKTIKFLFIDNGQGMSPSVLAKVWNPFFTTKESGTGLGLAICRQLTEEMGGTLEIKSLEGKGTEVNLTLPIEAKNLT